MNIEKKTSVYIYIHLNMSYHVIDVFILFLARVRSWIHCKGRSELHLAVAQPTNSCQSCLMAGQPASAATSSHNKPQPLTMAPPSCAKEFWTPRNNQKKMVASVASQNPCVSTCGVVWSQLLGLAGSKRYAASRRISEAENSSTSARSRCGYLAAVAGAVSAHVREAGPHPCGSWLDVRLPVAMIQ